VLCEAGNPIRSAISQLFSGCGFDVKNAIFVGEGAAHDPEAIA
jgi:hypothetical protein